MTRFAALALISSATFVSAASGQLLRAWGITNDERLVSFNPSFPGNLVSDTPITGLGATEKVLGIDARPASGQGELIIVTSENRLFSLALNGTATLIGSGFSPALSTQLIGFDFNPTVDRIRLVNSDASNRRLNPITGGNAANDTSLTYNDGSGLTPRATGTAYNNFQFGVGAAVGTIRQFIIDSDRDLLGEVGSQAGGNTSFNGGIVTPIGTGLGVDIDDDAGFDIFGPTQAAYISSFSTVTGLTTFYSLDLATGQATSLGTIPLGAAVIDFTLIPTPGAASLVGLGALAALRRRR